MRLLFAGLAAISVLGSAPGNAVELVEFKAIPWWTSDGNVVLPDGEFVARTSREWVDLWGKAEFEHGSHKPVAPNIDFSKYMVVAISRGIGADGCHSLTIYGAVEYSKYVEVRYAHRGGGGGPVQGGGFTACTASIVRLQAIAQVPRSHKKVRFHDIKRD